MTTHHTPTTTNNSTYYNEPRSVAELIDRYRRVKRRFYPPKPSTRILTAAPAPKIPISVLIAALERADKTTEIEPKTPETEDQNDPMACFEAEILRINSRKSKARAKAALKLVARRTGFSTEEIMARCRIRPRPEAQQQAIWTVKTATNWALTSVGRFFDGRDHTTILHAIRQFQKRAENNPELRAFMTEIERICAADTDCNKQDHNVIGELT